jgi:hypothetical protein
MRKLLAAIVYFSIGIGVVAVYCERHGKKFPEDGALFVSAVMWPAFAAAEIYRIVAPPVTKMGGDA